MNSNNLSITRKVAFKKCRKIAQQWQADLNSNDSWIAHCAARKHELHNRLNCYVQDYRGVKTYLAKRKVVMLYGWKIN